MQNNKDRNLTEDITLKTPDNQTEEEAPEATQPIDIGQYLRSYVTLGLIAGTVILLDQISKSIIRQQLAIGESWMPLEWLAPFARIIHWKNSGAAFGLFQGAGDLFTLLAIVVAAIIIYYYPQVPRRDGPLRLALGLQLGGAVGNLIDRLMQGYVTDFISVGTFPVFNLADSSITVGVVVLLLGVMISERQEKQAQDAVARTEGDVGANDEAPLGG